MSKSPSPGAMGVVAAGLRTERVPLLVPLLQQLVPCRAPAAFLALSSPEGRPGVTLVPNLASLEIPPEKTLHLELLLLRNRLMLRLFQN